MEFKLPDIGEGVTEGEIVKWLAHVGDTVKEDQPILEIMTDKATVEIVSPVSGKIASLGGKEGDMLKVGGLVALIEQGTAQTVSTPVVKSSAPVAAPPVSTPATPFTPAPPVPSTPTLVQPYSNSVSAASSSDFVLASPATRKLAREHHLSLADIPASGDNNRVLKSDVERMIGSTSSAAVSAGPVSSAAPIQLSKPLTMFDGSEERIPLKGIRKIIAENMLRSKLSAAHFTHVDEFNAQNLIQTKDRLKLEAEKQGISLTFLPFVIKAICYALKKYPRLNAMLDETKKEIVIKKYVNMGVAVVTKDDDLIVPVIAHADQKGLLELAVEIKQLAQKARENKLKPQELQGGTFTLTSMGSAGGLFGTPIINFPEVAIMGIHRIREVPIVKNGQIVPGKMANLSVSIDHRIVDGIMGSNFLMTVIEALENPSLMLL